MKEEAVSHINIQIKDALFKIDLYLNRIRETSGPSAQMEKICHLAAETCLKFCDKQDFSKQICQKLIIHIKQTKNYFFLYLLDILLKSNKNMMRMVKKDIQILFRLVWQQVWSEPKNSLKIQCLKAMCKTWGIIYKQKIEEQLKKWVQNKYNINLSLQKKYDDLFNELHQKCKFGKQGPFQIISPDKMKANTVQKKNLSNIDIELLKSLLQ